jgi:hypothetical protein
MTSLHNEREELLDTIVKKHGFSFNYLMTFGGKRCSTFSIQFVFDTFIDLYSMIFDSIQ